MESKNEKITQLELLVKQAKKEIEQKSASLEKLQEDLTGSEEKIQSAKEALRKLAPAKIFTRKELEALQSENLKKRRLELERQRQNIGLQTEKDFQLAREIRAQASEKPEEEKTLAYAQAFKLETNALKREVEVLLEISREKNEVYEDLLADIVCSKAGIRNLEHKSASNEMLGKLKAKVKNLKSLAAGVEKEIGDLALRVRKAETRLKLHLEN